MRRITILEELPEAFNTEEKCIQHLAKIRWRDSPICPNCGCTAHINYIERRRVWWCGDCARQFSIRIGTIFEGSRLSLRKWFTAIWLLTNSEDGVSVKYLALNVGVTAKTAKFILSRLRAVMPIADATWRIQDDNTI